MRAALSNKPTEFMGILRLIKQVVWPEIEPPKRALPEPDKPRSVVSPAPHVPPALREERARLVFAVDATASRSAAWEAAKELTDILFEAIPGKLDVALAVHGGGRVHTFTAFTDDAGRLRDMAMGIRCRSGDTRLIDILARAVREKPKVVVYIGDCFEESQREAVSVAEQLKAQGTRVIFLRDGNDRTAARVFPKLAALTGGAVLPFDLSSLGRLRELLGAVAVLAVGGEHLLEEKRETLPGAVLLLGYLEEAKRDGAETKKGPYFLRR